MSGILHSPGRGRYLILALVLLISLHWILALTHEQYGKAASLSSIASHFTGSKTNSYSSSDKFKIEQYYEPGAANETLLLDRRANATFVILSRNSNLDGAIKSMREIEDRFNKHHGYPYVFLNEDPFTDDFKRRISVLTSAQVEFGVIPHDHWFQPDWIDEAKATASRKSMEAEGVIYGGSLPYRNMCRFNSGFFFKHELLQKYRWYWRIEPDVHFHCNINFDPFLFMEDNNKVYSFTITLYEYQRTIQTLWDHVKKFSKDHPEYIVNGSSMNFLSDDNGNSYNLCHFWSNFEIADMNFWRGPAYTAFFDYLDSTGNFYYERWGDAPVHSIGAALFAKKEQIHFWDEIGYEHAPFTHCPQKEETWKKERCSCSRGNSFDYDGYSCLKRWDRLMGKQ